MEPALSISECHFVIADWLGSCDCHVTPTCKKPIFWHHKPEMIHLFLFQVNEGTFTNTSSVWIPSCSPGPHGPIPAANAKPSISATRKSTKISVYQRNSVLTNSKLNIVSWKMFWKKVSVKIATFTNMRSVYFPLSSTNLTESRG